LGKRSARKKKKKGKGGDSETGKIGRSYDSRKKGEGEKKKRDPRFVDGPNFTCSIVQKGSPKEDWKKALRRYTRTVDKGKGGGQDGKLAQKEKRTGRGGTKRKELFCLPGVSGGVD